jgi:hypothetical protein
MSITERVSRFRQGFEMTRHPLTISGRPKLRLFAPAAVEHEWTPGVEAAAAGRIDRARHVALQDHRVADGAGLRHRHGGADVVLTPDQNIENNPMQSSVVSLAWML